MPSACRTERSKKGWAEAFSEIVEFDSSDEDLIEKVLQTIRFSTKDWILLCTDENTTNQKIGELLKIDLVSGSRAPIEDCEEVD